MYVRLLLLVSFLGIKQVSIWGQGKIHYASQLFDGLAVHDGWGVWVDGDTIREVGPLSSMPAELPRSDLGDHTLMPGMIEGHSHILLHPYNETSWNDQVLSESHAERVVRATVHARKTLEAGFTTIRDLGSEGAGYADVGVKEAIAKGIIPGPDMLVAGKAIVASGSYGPKGFAEHVKVPLGAETADGVDDLTKVVRDQIGHGADVIKVYADYRWGPFGQAMPTFTQEELELIVAVASSSGRPVVAHAATAEGMRRAVMAGAQTIEHGDAGTREVFQLMKEKGVALCPTLAAGDAIMQYRGWKKGVEEDPPRIVAKKASFAIALQEEVAIVAGGDVGVFPHGDNVRELEMMVEYGMSDEQVLIRVTSGNASLLQLPAKGTIEVGKDADLIAVDGNPWENISVLRQVKWVMKGGKVFVDQSN